MYIIFTLDNLIGQVFENKTELANLQPSNHQSSWTWPIVCSSLLISGWDYSIRPNNDVKPKRRNAANSQICHRIITFSVSVLSSEGTHRVSFTMVGVENIQKAMQTSLKIDSVEGIINIKVITIALNNELISA